jgi:hypothetical protein
MAKSLAAAGVDITMEAYPYTAGMTNIASNVYAGDLAKVQSYFAPSKVPECLQWLETGEYLTPESFYRLRQQTEETGVGGMVYNHTIPQARRRTHCVHRAHARGRVVAPETEPPNLL